MVNSGMRVAALAAAILAYSPGAAVIACGDLPPGEVLSQFDLSGPAEYGRAVAVGDFDEDGVDDFAVAAPQVKESRRVCEYENGREIPGSCATADKKGGIQVRYSGDLLSCAEDRFLTINELLHDAGIPAPYLGSPGDEAGIVLAAGDFDGNGSDDLAVGIPGFGITRQWDPDLLDWEYAWDPSAPDWRPAAGLVLVMHGYVNRDLGKRSYVLKQKMVNWNGPISNGVPEAGDRFGSSLAVGDFDGDGYDDLAVGAPYEDVSGAADAGTTHVFFGHPLGFTDAEFSPTELVRTDWMLGQDQSWIWGGPETGDRHGTALAAGDYNGDGFDDLAVAAPGEDLHYSASGTQIVDTGWVHLYYGGGGGFSKKMRDFATTTTFKSPQSGERFGSSLAMADFDADGFADLAIGAPRRSCSGLARAGEAFVAYGSSSGGRAYQRWTQNSVGIGDACESNDLFASQLGAGDFNGDGYADLVVGSPYESVTLPAYETVIGAGTVMGAAGLVNVLYGSGKTLVPGSAPGLTAAGTQTFHQSFRSVPDSAEVLDFFGAALAAGDLDGDGIDDLLIGVPGEDLRSLVNHGAVHELPGTVGGLDDAPSWLFRLE